MITRILKFSKMLTLGYGGQGAEMGSIIAVETVPLEVDLNRVVHLVQGV